MPRTQDLITLATVHYNRADIAYPAHKHRTTMAPCWMGPQYSRTAAVLLNSNRTSAARRPCFHLTAALQTSCDHFFLYLTSWRTVPAVMWLREKIFGIAVRWHFAGCRLPAAGLPRKIVLAPLICDLGIRHCDPVGNGYMVWWYWSPVAERADRPFLSSWIKAVIAILFTY